MEGLLFVAGIVVGALFHKPILTVMRVAGERLKSRKGARKEEIGRSQY
jgi:hypothetical protein